MRKLKKVSTRDTKQVKIWLIGAGLTVTEIAKELEISKPVVTNTIHGYANNKKVLRLLLGRGCPREVLDLPDQFRGGETAERRTRKRQPARA